MISREDIEAMQDKPEIDYTYQSYDEDEPTWFESCSNKQFAFFCIATLIFTTGIAVWL